MRWWPCEHVKRRRGDHGHDGFSVPGVPQERVDEIRRDGLAAPGAMSGDGETVRFVLLKKTGMPFMNGGVPDDILNQVIGELRG